MSPFHMRKPPRRMVVAGMWTLVPVPILFFVWMSRSPGQAESPLQTSRRRRSRWCSVPTYCRDCKEFLAIGSTYRFSTDQATWTGVVVTRLHDHWVQVELVGPGAAAPPMPTWFNLLHIHTVAEVGGTGAKSEGVQAGAP